MHAERAEEVSADSGHVQRVGDELGMSATTVLQAKYRVLKRLREESGELLE